MAARPPAAVPIRVREMNLYRRYFDLVTDGTKTVEVRVCYPNLDDLAEGDHIRFICGRDECLTRVRRVARYDSFEALLDAEGPEKVNPASARDQQLASIRQIYAPEKEALGVLAIEIERAQARPDRSEPASGGSAGLPLEPADADRGEHDDVSGTGQQGLSITPTPGGEIEDACVERHHGAQWCPRRDRRPDAAEHA
jgi:ASC-1-like (ASCH) protein